MSIQSRAPAVPSAGWTVLVYSIADTDLEPFLLDDVGEMAETTGGVYRLAEDSESLIDIYREIDQLEKSEIEAVRYLNYRELFTPFALFGLFFLVVEALLRSTVLRTIP